jgi:putative ubiquitin-RnfH superfamily antitoxin RatB of RatAB toxin-antitoxin module
MSTEADSRPAGGSADSDRVTAGSIRVEVVYATPERQTLLALDVPAGCTVGQAIERSGIRDRHPELVVDPAAVGIFARKVGLEQALREGDRVEIYRPLQADPKESRRRRARRKAQP